MRILIDSQTLSTANVNRGIGVYLKNILYHLVELNRSKTDSSKNDIYIGVFDDYSKESIDQIYSKIKIISLGKKFYIDNSEEYDNNINDTIKKYNIDIFWIPNPVSPNVHLIKSKISCKTVISFHDLIPLIFEDDYLKNWPKIISQEYIFRIMRLEKISDIIVTVSDSTRKDLIEILEINPSKLKTIHHGVKIYISDNGKNYDKEYILYVGGFDKRKNMEKAVLAFENLVEKYGYDLNFVIVGQFNEYTNNFLNFLKDLKIFERVKLTDYVTDGELSSLYKNAKVFFFPTLYEGYGLPLIEAMAMEVPIAASNCSSIPEVIEDAGLLFDPEDINDMTEKLNIIISNNKLAESLREKGKDRSNKFSWERSARELLQTFENLFSKLKLAYFTCLSPLKSGISDYSEELLPYLSKYADIDIFIDNGYRPSNKNVINKFGVFNYKEIEKKIDDYDTIIYNMGNNTFHIYTYNMLMKYKGIVIFHDIYLHGLIWNMTLAQGDKTRYIDEFKYCYGEKGKIVAEEAIKSGSYPDFEYPLLKRMLDNSLGAIVHSEFGKNIVLNEKKDIDVIKINQPMPVSKKAMDKNVIREKLRIGNNEIIIVSFGYIFPHKRIHKAICAFAKFHKKFPSSKYFLIGQSHDNGSLNRLVEELGIKKSVIFTGFLPLEKAMEYITASDICMNLRYPTAGETSSSALRILGIGRPVVVSDVGWFSELPDNCSAKVDIDNCEEDMILEYLNVFASNEKLRIKMGKNAKKYILDEYDPEKIAYEYYTFISKIIRKRDNPRRL